MSDDLEKAARRWAKVHSTSAKCPCSACEALRAALPGEENLVTCGRCDGAGKVPMSWNVPTSPAVTREEVTAGLARAHPDGEYARLCRSWLALEEGNTYLSVQVERLNEENARLRAVAEAAEDLQQKVRSERTRATQESRTWLVPEHCVMAVRAALRRLKEGE